MYPISDRIQERKGRYIMESYEFLLFLAIILFATKICGLFSRKFHMPQVVGALLAGVILGPVRTESDQF